MFDAYDLIIRGGCVASHTGRVEADIGVKEGRIKAIGDLGDSVGDDVFDAKGLTVMPGVIDTQVHFREPDGTQGEDLESGARSAVLGGVTSVFDMANSRPNTTRAEHCKDKIKRAKNRMWCDFAFYVGATPETTKTLGWMEKTAGIAGVSVDMGADEGDLLVPDDEALFHILRHGARRVAIHAEDHEWLKGGLGDRTAGDASSHSIWRDEMAAAEAVKRAITQARRAGRRIHIQKVSTAEEISFLGGCKDIASLAVTPQHLTLTAPDAYDTLGNRAVDNPPLRGERHRSALWRGIMDGTIDLISSAHRPLTAQEKAKPYPECPAGMPGVQTLLPVMLTHVANGNLSLERLIDLTSAGPSRVFRLRDKGFMAVGCDADFVLVDLAKEWTITHDVMASKSGWTPFDGFKATGKPVATIVRGHVVMRDGGMASQAVGKPVRFSETLKAQPLEDQGSQSL